MLNRSAFGLIYLILVSAVTIVFLPSGIRSQDRAVDYYIMVAQATAVSNSYVRYANNMKCATAAANQATRKKTVGQKAIDFEDFRLMGICSAMAKEALKEIAIFAENIYFLTVNKDLVLGQGWTEEQYSWVEKWMDKFKDIRKNVKKVQESTMDLFVIDRMLEQDRGVPDLIA